MRRSSSFNVSPVYKYRLPCMLPTRLCFLSLIAAVKQISLILCRYDDVEEVLLLLFRPKWVHHHRFSWNCIPASGSMRARQQLISVSLMRRSRVHCWSSLGRHTFMKLSSFYRCSSPWCTRNRPCQTRTQQMFQMTILKRVRLSLWPVFLLRSINAWIVKCFSNTKRCVSPIFFHFSFFVFCFFCFFCFLLRSGDRRVCRDNHRCCHQSGDWHFAGGGSR